MKKSVAIVGYGGQGAWHADCVLKSDVVSLSGVFDIDSARMDIAKSKGIHTYNSFNELILDNNVDIVVCATPNDVHEEIVISALRAGKSVVCEKPVTLSVESFDRMVAASKQTGNLFTVHQNRRWDVDFLGIKSIIEDGKIGDVINIESRIHGSRGIPSDWRCQKEFGGGMLFDWGVHLIDQMLLLISQQIESVACNCTYITTTEVDDGFKLRINFKDGKFALIEVGTLNFIPLARFYLQCKKGTAIITDWREKTKVVHCKHWHENDVLPVQSAAGITKTMAPRNEITIDNYEIERPISDVHDFYRNLVKAIDGLEPMIVTHTQLRRVLKVIEAAFESDRLGGTPVKFDENK